ncbi:MAG: proline racemase family protein [Alphaproteobacteria bacterium]|nr:proline racemase family protein [Alphaproteobacteria bacterium]
MLKNRFIDCIYTHTEGEPTCIIHHGIPYPAGLDILGKRAFLEKNYDWLRQSLMREPRGHQDMFGVFVTPPSSPDYDAGMIWMDGTHFHDMCGHGTIALSMALVSHNLVPVTGNRTTIRYETTAGDVTAEVASNDQAAEWTRFENVPAYVAERDIPLDVPEVGRVNVDLSFGGNYFIQLNWGDRQPRISPENASYFSRLGLLVKKLFNEKVKVVHPTKPHIKHVDFTTIYHDGTLPGAFYRNVHVFSDGKMDRSPGGTGTSAMLAMLESRGRIKIGQTIKSEGLLGSGTFEGCIVRETKLGNHRAFVPTVKGTANVIGYAKWLMSPDDPVSKGFVIS